MSSISPVEKRKMEKLLEMSSGIVMNFSNRTFKEFIIDVVEIDIYEDKYSEKGNSKANRLRMFWEKEDDNKVGKLMLEMLKAWYSNKQNSYQEIMDNEQKLYEECIIICERLFSNIEDVLPAMNNSIQNKSVTPPNILVPKIAEEDNTNIEDDVLQDVFPNNSITEAIQTNDMATSFLSKAFENLPKFLRPIIAITVFLLIFWGGYTYIQSNKKEITNIEKQGNISILGTLVSESSKKTLNHVKVSLKNSSLYSDDNIIDGVFIIEQINIPKNKIITLLVQYPDNSIYEVKDIDLSIFKADTNGKIDIGVKYVNDLKMRKK